MTLIGKERKFIIEMSSKPTIFIENTIVHGVEKVSIHGKKYYAFLGIPYAQPPIEKLRFSPPQPIEYPSVIEATEYKNAAVQVDSKLRLFGDEDCLYLNIFIPELPMKDSRPVMYYIHGGSYSRYAADDRFSPKLLIEYDIVMVTLNYRLGVFGFLNLGLPECPGNVGAKDLVCGLHWVKKYIKYFGGNPDNITMMGTSSGASLAHLMAVSPLCKDMFTKVILISGLANSPFNYIKSPIENAFKLGNALGFEGHDKNQLFKFLQSCSSEKLIKATTKLDKIRIMKLTRNVFLPSIESIEQDAFLPEDSDDLLEKIDPIRIIGGISEFEGVLLLKNQDFPTNLPIQEIMRKIIEENISMKSEHLENVLKEVFEFYLSPNKSTQTSLQEFVSDMYLKDYYRTVELFQDKFRRHQFYNYLFTYCGNSNISKKAWEALIGVKVKGTYHADEHGYVFLKTNDSLTEKDFEVAHHICKSFTNFAKFGNPNGNGTNDFWVSSTSENSCYLEIGEEMKMVPGIINVDRAQFWIVLKNKYSF